MILGNSIFYLGEEDCILPEGLSLGFWDLQGPGLQLSRFSRLSCS